MPASVVSTVCTTVMTDFDLNIKRILTTWKVPHACRELVANAFDEHELKKLDRGGVVIDLKGDCLTIKDQGRGIEKLHFVQDESDEKVSNFKNFHIIGHFGVGLKDAVAVLMREGRTLEIRSRHGRYTFQYKNKHGHDDVITLHVIIHDDVPQDFVGTEITVRPFSGEEQRQTKDLFLMFSKREVLFECPYGQVLSNDGDGGAVSSIYVKGLRVDENQQYHFSYNIYELNKALREKMSRDKNSISMGIYSGIVKKILTSTAKSDPLYGTIEELVVGRPSRDLKTDVGYKDIIVHFTKSMDSKVIVTQEQCRAHPGVYDEVKDRVQVVSKEQYAAITRSEGRKCQTIEEVIKIGVDHGDEVTPKKMTQAEKEVFDFGNEVIRSNPDIFGSLSVPKIVRDLELRGRSVSGMFSNREERICIDYNQLRKGGYAYLGTLAHEHAHKKSGATDCTKEFEHCLTEMLGRCIDRFCARKSATAAKAVAAPAAQDAPPTPKRRKLAPVNGIIEID